MPRISNDEFLGKVGEYMSSTKKKKQESKTESAASVTLSMKRYVPAPEHDTSMKVTNKRGYKPHGQSNSVKVPHPNGEPVCLMHVQLGNKKCSTVVTASNHVEFQKQFALIMKVNSDALLKASHKRKRDEMQKEEKAAKQIEFRKARKKAKK